MLSRNLIIALEPEAASLWCKQLPQEGFMADSSDKKNPLGSSILSLTVEVKFSLFNRNYLCWACCMAIS